MTQSNKRLTETVKIRLKDKIIDLSIDDILKNNIIKLTKEIPNLKISDSLSAQNPLKKIMTILESGPQNQYKYYRYLSFFIFLYIWVIQIAALCKGEQQAVVMLMVSCWATYAIIRLNVKPLFKINILKALFAKADIPIFISSITYSLLLLSIGYIVLNKGSLCFTMNWNSIADILTLKRFSYLPYLFAASLGVAILIGLYNIYEFYERSILSLEIGKNTKGVMVFGFTLYLMMFLFLPLIASELLCESNGVALLFLALSVFPYMLMGILSLQFFSVVFIIIKKTAMHLNKRYN